MSLDVLVFGLRVISVVLLVGFIGSLFMLIWRDYQVLLQQSQHTKRIHGQLLGLIQVDNHLTPTGKTYALLPITTIGRAPTNTIVIDNAFASAEHALIALRNNQWWLEDRSSRNGTLLNQDPVTLPTIVTDGDVIGIGNFFFQVVLE